MNISANNGETVSTNIPIHIPNRTYGRIAPKSGIAFKYAIDIGAGVINKDYRGPVMICILNYSNIDFQVKIGDQIGKLILEWINNPETKLVEFLSLTKRGT